MTDDLEVDELKIGAMISRANKEKIQAAIDELNKLIEEVVEPEAEAEEMPDDEMMCYQGGEVKALGDGKLGGYLVRFSTADDPDLTGDYFTKDTDLKFLTDNGKLPILYNHGLDGTLKKRQIGEGTIRIDDVGAWLDAQLYLRDDYEKGIERMAANKKQGLSSGALSHLVERVTPTKGASWIKQWWVGEGSITPTPAEPRNTVVSLKSLLVAQPEAAMDRAAEPAANVDPTIVIQPSSTKEITMDITQEMLDTLVTNAATKAVEAYRKSEPAEKTPHVTITKDEAEQPFPSSGAFFKAVRYAALDPQGEDRRLRPLKVVETKATGMSENIPADGGYLVTPQYAPGLIERVYQTGSLLDRIAKDPVTGNSMSYNAIDETSRASTLYGGVVAYWLSEGGTYTASAPKFRQMELKLKKVTALAYATEEQLEDSQALESWLMRNVPNALRFKIEDAIYEGDGVGKPQGMLSSNCLVTVTRDTASKIAMIDILNMWSRRWAGANDYIWLMNQDVVPQLATMAGTYQNVFMPAGGLSGAMYATLLGKPIIETEYAQSLNTKGDIMLASPSQYQSIVKGTGDPKVLASPYVAFTTGEMAYRFTHRIDGQPVWNAALTPFHGSNTQSPFVVLGSASA